MNKYDLSYADMHGIRIATNPAKFKTKADLCDFAQVLIELHEETKLQFFEESNRALKLEEKLKEAEAKLLRTEKALKSLFVVAYGHAE